MWFLVTSSPGTYLQIDGITTPYGVSQMFVISGKGYTAVLSGQRVFAIPMP